MREPVEAAPVHRLVMRRLENTMTTEAAERLYEAQHGFEWSGRGWAIHNPGGKPEDELPVIFGFNNGGVRGCMSACLIAEDGTGLGGHICTSEAYMPDDLGVLDGTRADRHETFRKHYPDGYRMEFVRYNDVRGHQKLMAAIAIANAKSKDAKQSESA
jgi:hypothetical protein